MPSKQKKEEEEEKKEEKKKEKQKEKGLDFIRDFKVLKQVPELDSYLNHPYSSNKRTIFCITNREVIFIDPKND